MFCRRQVRALLFSRSFFLLKLIVDFLGGGVCRVGGWGWSCMDGCNIALMFHASWMPDKALNYLLLLLYAAEITVSFS